MSALLFIPPAVVVILLLFRSINFSQLQGIFLLGVASSVVISYYTGGSILYPIIAALIAEAVVNVLIGIKGTTLSPKIYNYLLVAIGLFPWMINPWATGIYALSTAVGFSIGVWSRRDTKVPVYSMDLFGVAIGLILAWIISTALTA